MLENSGTKLNRDKRNINQRDRQTTDQNLLQNATNLTQRPEGKDSYLFIEVTKYCRFYKILTQLIKERFFNVGVPPWMLFFLVSIQFFMIQWFTHFICLISPHEVSESKRRDLFSHTI